MQLKLNIQLIWSFSLCCIGWGQTTRQRAPCWSWFPEYLFIPCLVTGTPSSSRLVACSMSFSWLCTQPPLCMFSHRNSSCLYRSQNSTAWEALHPPHGHGEVVRGPVQAHHQVLVNFQPRGIHEDYSAFCNNFLSFSTAFRIWISGRRKH